MGDVRIRAGGTERVPALEQLWKAMHSHHAALGGLPAVRPVEDSWQKRSEQYAQWLAREEALLLVAEQGGEPVGYAMVRFEPGPPTWAIGNRVAELESLSVAAQARGLGIGAMLIAAARQASRQGGAERLLVAVAHTNVDALRFYEREGFAPFYVLLVEEADHRGMG